MNPRRKIWKLRVVTTKWIQNNEEKIQGEENLVQKIQCPEWWSQENLMCRKSNIEYLQKLYPVIMQSGPEKGRLGEWMKEKQRERERERERDMCGSTLSG